MTAPRDRILTYRRERENGHGAFGDIKGSTDPAGRFIGGFETTDLKKAKALLEEFVI